MAWLNRAGADLRAIFDAPTTSIRQRKQLLAILIREVVVTVDRPDGRAEARIIWEGGATSEFNLTLPRRGDNAPRTEQDTVELIRRLAAHYDDATIARLLVREGRITATGLPFTKSRVNHVRRHYDIPGPEPDAAVTGSGDDVHMASITEAEQLLSISRATLYRWLADGFIAGEQDTPGGPWRIRIDAVLRAKIVPDLPDGWVGLNEAAKALGVARQTVLDRVRRGELDAVHVTRGRRNGLAIRIPTAATLFDAADDPATCRNRSNQATRKHPKNEAT